jgi:activating signal cointegrator 1
VKGLTLWQPWASVASLGEGAKPHDTRGWPTSYRGPLLIHAAKRWDGTIDAEWRKAREALEGAGRFDLPADPPLGAVVAVAEIVDCRPMGGLNGVSPSHDLDRVFGIWSEGRWAWRLANVRRLPEPIPWPGAQGFWNVPADLERLVKASLEAPRPET